MGAGQWARVLAMVAQIRAMDMEVCTTLGMLTPEQARPTARAPACALLDLRALEVWHHARRAAACAAARLPRARGICRVVGRPEQVRRP